MQASGLRFAYTMKGQIFLTWLAGLYTIRLIWNHGHYLEAALLSWIAAILTMVFDG